MARATAERVKPFLLPGESLIWAAPADARLYMRRALPLVLLVWFLPGLAILALPGFLPDIFARLEIEHDPADIPWLLEGLALAGSAFMLAALLRILLAARRARRVLWALTGWRLVEIDRATGRTTSWLPGRLRTGRRLGELMLLGPGRRRTALAASGAGADLAGTLSQWQPAPGAPPEPLEGSTLVPPGLLAPGETPLWAARPHALRQTLGMVEWWLAGLVLPAIAAVALVALVESGELAQEGVAATLAGLFAVGLLALLVPVVHYLVARRTRYVLTDRRLMVASARARRPRRELPLDQLVELCHAGTSRPRGALHVASRLGRAAEGGLVLKAARDLLTLEQLILRQRAAVAA